MNCIFCDIDNNKIENTIIEETNNFWILPSVGSLVDGYLLIISKRHINSMADLQEYERKEYEFIINKYRNLFKDVYDNYPIIFEHGSPVLKDDMKANSIIHAHTHIVNYQFENEKELIKTLNFKKIDSINQVSKNKNYILYINQTGICFVTYKFDPISQLMRKKIAEELGIENLFDWRKNLFVENIQSTIKKIKLGDTDIYG